MPRRLEILTKDILTRMTPEEYDLVVRWANQTGLSYSALVRKAVIGTLTQWEEAGQAVFIVPGPKK